MSIVSIIRPMCNCVISLRLSNLRQMRLVWRKQLSLETNAAVASVSSDSEAAK